MLSLSYNASISFPSAWKSHTTVEIISLKGMPTLQSVCLTGVSTCQWCPPYKGVHLTQVSAF